MINPSFEELKEISESRYAICMVASKRARKLIEKSKPLVNSKNFKPVTVAMDEIMAGKIKFESKDNESIK